jgi:hypothetical protein
MAKQEIAAEEQAPVAAVRVWATKAGHLPETFPGNRLRPVRFNRESWKVQAVCLHRRWSLDSEISETTYNEAVAALSAVDAR